MGQGKLGTRRNNKLATWKPSWQRLFCAIRSKQHVGNLETKLPTPIWCCQGRTARWQLENQVGNVLVCVQQSWQLDLLLFKDEYLEPQGSNWHDSNCVEKLTSRAFQRYTIVHNVARNGSSNQRET
ncbi:uncharacterized protein DS421_1g15000 [Arachis hypogaea]|nr:uncharacterized protein DS421_1g14980 [Arachis hypogaea]QHO49554.1 uncharacterized protein DS421_1g15000 [Arachis hypogaea]